MQNRRRVRNLGGTAAAALLSGCLGLYGCTDEQYEKPEKKEEPTAEATEPPAPPTEPPAAEETAPPAEAEPAAEDAPVAPAEGGRVAAVPEAAPADEVEPPAEEEEEAAGEVEGGLALLGIVRAGGQAPAALIEYQGSQEIFRKGDSVFGQGTLGEVRTDSVVL
ncbi:MAG: type II secretion system protein N, partial [Candidatus Binatia bacterium]